MAADGKFNERTENGFSNLCLYDLPFALICAAL